MGSVQDGVEVAASADRVWDAVVDYEARTQWSPRMKEARVLDDGPLREGSRIRLHKDRDRFTATVVEIRPPERLTLLVKGPGFRVHHTYELRTGGDHTGVTLTGDYRGVIGRLVARFMRGSVQRDVIDELAAIKVAAEAGRSE